MFKYMDKYINLLIFIIVVLFLYWVLNRYNKNNKNNEIKKLTEYIKNNITITTYNMNQFIDQPSDIKVILLDVARTYKHNDIIKLLKYQFLNK